MHLWLLFISKVLLILSFIRRLAYVNLYLNPLTSSPGSIFRHLKLELLTQFPASNDEKYINVVYILRKFVSFYGYVHWRMTTEISVMYGSEKVKALRQRTKIIHEAVSRYSYLFVWDWTFANVDVQTLISFLISVIWLASKTD